MSLKTNYKRYKLENCGDFPQPSHQSSFLTINPISKTRSNEIEMSCLGLKIDDLNTAIKRSFQVANLKSKTALLFTNLNRSFLSVRPLLDSQLSRKCFCVYVSLGEGLTSLFSLLLESEWYLSLSRLLSSTFGLSWK